MARNAYAQLQAGRELAADRRGRGLPTGSAAAGWIRTTTRRPDSDLDPFERIRIRAKAELRSFFAGVLDDYQRAAFPDRFTDDEIPF